MYVVIPYSTLFRARESSDQILSLPSPSSLAVGPSYTHFSITTVCTVGCISLFCYRPPLTLISPDLCLAPGVSASSHEIFFFFTDLTTSVSNRRLRRSSSPPVAGSSLLDLPTCPDVSRAQDFFSIARADFAGYLQFRWWLHSLSLLLFIRSEIGCHQRLSAGLDRRLYFKPGLPRSAFPFLPFP